MRPDQTRTIGQHDDLLGRLYDDIGLGYSRNRRADPRIERRIHEALGDARSVLNVGAGAGAYEPKDLTVLALEPSDLMRAQRGRDAAPCIAGVAESLALTDDSVDAAMALMSLHHWTDWRAGISELQRVACGRVVIFTYDPAFAERWWLGRDYLPDLARIDARRFPSIEEQAAAVGEGASVETVPIPYDCRDGFLGAYWRRPHAYLYPVIRAGISTFQLPAAELLLDGLDRLGRDLESGRWEERHGELLQRTELDLGYRLLVSEPKRRTPAGSRVPSQARRNVPG